MDYQDEFELILLEILRIKGFTKINQHALELLKSHFFKIIKTKMNLLSNLTESC